MNNERGKKANLVAANCRLARQLWGPNLGTRQLHALRELTQQFGLSLAAGGIQLIDGKWYITHTGLLRIAHRNRCFGIRTALDRQSSDPDASRWVFKSTVYKSPRSRGFVGYGDADPSNVSSLVRGAEMRVAETRAVNRALRKAYGIGLCSVEELGSFSPSFQPSRKEKQAPVPCATGISGNGQPRLRDRLCQLIRQYRLDPALVKRYAAEFCGTETLRDSNREMVEAFVNKLADWAAKDRAGLVCHLSGYAQPPGAKS